MTVVGDTVVLDVRVIPRASKSQIAGTRGGALLIRLNAPPLDGAANDELIRLLADTLDIPKRDIAVISGERSRSKRVRVAGRTADDVRRRLSRYLGDES
jgi:uncharacterized protein (TIGR00251 family)